MGLTMLWQKQLCVMISSYSKYHISEYLTKKEGDKRCFFTKVYGHLETSRREETWSLIRAHVVLGRSIPWLVVEDFNELLSKEEKARVWDRLEIQLVAFRATTDDCGLKDLGFEGFAFMWCNRRGTQANISECLDRCLAN